jgi:hypothetical protein
MEREELEKVIAEVIQETDKAKEISSARSLYRFNIILFPIIFCFGITMYILTFVDMQFSSLFIKDLLIKRMLYVGSIIFMSISALGMLLALWVKFKKIN